MDEDYEMTLFRRVRIITSLIKENVERTQNAEQLAALRRRQNTDMPINNSQTSIYVPLDSLIDFTEHDKLSDRTPADTIGPSHNYGIFRQQTGIPQGLNANAIATNSGPRNSSGVVVDDHNLSNRTSNAGRLWPGMHQQQAALAKAQQARQAQQVRQAQQKQQQSLINQKGENLWDDHFKHF